MVTFEVVYGNLNVPLSLIAQGLEGSPINIINIINIK